MFANMLAIIRKIFAESAKCWICEVDLLAEAEGLVTPGRNVDLLAEAEGLVTSARGGVSFTERTSKPPPIDTVATDATPLLESESATAAP